MKRLATLALLLALGTACTAEDSRAFREALDSARQPTTTVAGAEDVATVAKITDGDTLHVTLAGADETLRLIGIDTPETKKPGSPVQCYGPEATAELTGLIPVGSPVRLTYDKERTDRYGRTLAYVFATGADGTEFDVGGTMVARGAAKAKRYPPNTAHAVVYERAQASAKAERLGLWGRCAA